MLKLTCDKVKNLNDRNDRFEKDIGKNFKNKLIMEEFKKKKVIKKCIFFNLNLTLKILNDFFSVIQNKNLNFKKSVT